MGLTQVETLESYKVVGPSGLPEETSVVILDRKVVIIEK
jgi:hypothetical protein